MAKFILNKNKQDSENGGNYELHNADKCRFLPDVANRLTIGYFFHCQMAMHAAKEGYPEKADDIDGCGWCCPQCNNE